MLFWKQILSATMLLTVAAVAVSAQESLDLKPAHRKEVGGKALGTKGVAKKKIKFAKGFTTGLVRSSQGDGDLSVKSSSPADPASGPAPQEFNWNGIYGGIHMGGGAVMVSH